MIVNVDIKESDLSDEQRLAVEKAIHEAYSEGYATGHKAGQYSQMIEYVEVEGAEVSH